MYEKLRKLKNKEKISKLKSVTLRPTNLTKSAW